MLRKTHPNGGNESAHWRACSAKGGWTNGVLRGWLRPSSCNFLLGARRVVPYENAINDHVLSPTESRRYADIHVFRNFLTTKVTRDYGPFAQPRIDDLIEL